MVDLAVAKQINCMLVTAIIFVDKLYKCNKIFHTKFFLIHHSQRLLGTYNIHQG